MPAATDEAKETKETPEENEPVPPSEPTAGESVEVPAEAEKSSAPSPITEEPADPQLELIPKAAEETASDTPALSVSGTAAQALIAQLFQTQPVAEAPAEPVSPAPDGPAEIAVPAAGISEQKSLFPPVEKANPPTTEAPAESVRPAPNAPVEIGVPAAEISEQKPLFPPVEKASAPTTETPVAAAPPAEKRTERKAEFSIRNLPSDVGSELPPAAKISRPAPRPISEPADIPKPLVVETPAQANHVFELIAAAVQRGAVVGGPVAEPGPPVTPLEAEAPAREELPTSVPEESEHPSSATVEPSDMPPAVKTPAKIRITPRKIKPRAPIAVAEPPPSAPAVPETVAPPPDYAMPNFPPSSSMLSALAPALPLAAEPPKVAGEPRAPRPPVEPWQGRMPPRKIAASGFEAESDPGLFTAPERRNRWIGFGLSEAAALTSLILLGRFVLLHKFPDPTLKLLVFILFLAAAAIAVAIPIAFIRNNPTRWQR